MKKILVLHGPNLHLLGQRENHLYGSTSLDTLNQTLLDRATAQGYSLIAEQSNSEASLIDRIVQASTEKVHCIIFNPAAFTHTSIALRDTLLAVEIPFIEVHLSNIFKREAFRHHSYLSDIAMGVISGFGALSYMLALEAAMNFLNLQKK